MRLRAPRATALSILTALTALLVGLLVISPPAQAEGDLTVGSTVTNPSGQGILVYADEAACTRDDRKATKASPWTIEPEFVDHFVRFASGSGASGCQGPIAVATEFGLTGLDFLQYDDTLQLGRLLSQRPIPGAAIVATWTLPGGGTVVQDGFTYRGPVRPALDIETSGTYTLTLELSHPGYLTETVSATVRPLFPVPDVSTEIATRGGGDARAGSTLEVVQVTSPENGDDYFFPTSEWTRDGASVDIRTGEVSELTYEVTEADELTEIRLTTTYDTALDNGRFYATATSNPVAVVGTFEGGAVTVPAARVGSSVAADVTPPTPEPDGVAFQWLRSGTPIADATDPAYTPVVSDADRALRMQVTFTRDGYTPLTVTSDPVTVQLGELGSPTTTIAGTTVVGEELTASFTSTPPAGQVDHEWFRAPVDATTPTGGTSVATGPTYAPVPEDVGRRLYVVATASDTDGYDDVSVPSPLTPEVAPGTISGLALVVPPSVVATNPIFGIVTRPSLPADASIDYQWFLLDGGGRAAIPGATNSTFVPPASYGERTIELEVTASRFGYEDATASGQALVRRASVELPAIDVGVDPTVGVPISADLSEDPTPDSARVTWQWYANGRAIDGADRSTYVPTPDTRGDTLTVRAVGSVPYYRAGRARATAGVVDRGAMSDFAVTTSPDPAVGTPVVASTGGPTAPADAEISWRWYVDGVPVLGAETDTFVPQVEDLGGDLRAVATARHPGYDDRTVAIDAGTVAPGTIDGFTVDLSGRARVGNVLRADVDGVPRPEEVSYAWYSGEQRLGRRGPALRVRPRMFDQPITVSVRGALPGYDEATATAGPTDPVTMRPARLRAPRVAGPGDRIRIRARHLVPRERFVVRLQGSGVIARGKVRRGGTVRREVRIPRSAGPGVRRLAIRSAGPGRRAADRVRIRNR